MNKRIKKKLKKQSGWRKLTKERKLALKIINAFIQYKELPPYECLAKIKKKFPKGTISFIRLEPINVWDGLARIHCKLDTIDIIQDYTCGTAFSFGYKCSHVDMTDWDKVKICGNRFEGSIDEFEELNTWKAVEELDSQIGVLPVSEPNSTNYSIKALSSAINDILKDNTIKAPVDYLGIDKIKGDSKKEFEAYE